jgi:hypothetical protein
MGQTLTIWKWRTVWPFRSESRVMSSIEQDRAPLALARFDASGFAEEIRRRFGDGEEAPFVVDVCAFTGNRANWLAVSCGWGVPPERITELLRMCDERGLHVHSE